MSAPHAEPANPALTQRIRAEQVRMLYANAGFPMVTTLGVAGGLAWVLIWSGTLRPVAAGVWLTAMVLHTAVRQLTRLAFLRADPPDAAWKTWADRFVIGAFVGAVTWGVGSLWLLAPGRFDLQMLVVTVLMAVIYGGMTGFGAYLPGFFVFFLPAFLPLVVWFGVQGDVLHGVCTGFFLAWVPTVVVLARRYNAGLVQALELRFINAALVEDLTAQKAIAEQASLAKSRFLASASHDLRQPVHALGMFVGALRGHRLEARSIALIDQVDASVAALDGLFTSLLDISRLDAGAVRGEPGDIAVQPLLDRVCRDLAAEAQGKGVALIQVPTALAIRSDPVLLERVMRNLVGNAVRYTETGSVLVGARRRGAGVSLEVWDTGCGIPEAQTEAVFEEFFQVANPDRDRTKGLGLGLPIVRRLTDILGHPLAMHSVVGKGSVFRVLAPRADAAEALEAAAEQVLTPATGLVLAIDDEQAIRAAMRELLTGWGHQVIAVSGGAHALRAVAGGARPDLIVCDFRLRDGESGVAVIAALREALGEAVPAILLSGDTAPENLRLALASGYPLLHKPLAHARLRAAVSALMRRPREAPAG